MIIHSLPVKQIDVSAPTDFEWDGIAQGDVLDST